MKIGIFFLYVHSLFQKIHILLNHFDQPAGVEQGL